jgi:PDZ domain
MRIAILIVLGLSLGAAAPALADTKADQLLAEAKQATGGGAWDAIISWHEAGTMTSGGLSGSYEGWIDLPGARRAVHFNLGALSGSRGWDGQAGWSADASGQVRRDDGGEAMADARQDAYDSALAYWFPERMPAERVYAGERREDGETYDAVKLTPAGAEPFEVWIDRNTHRIGRAVQLTGSHPETEIYSDFRKIDGVLVPFQVRDTSGDRQFDTTSTASRIEFNQPIRDGTFEPPAPPPSDAFFPAGSDRVTLGFDLVENQIYLPVRLNGGASITALFDTGSLDVLDRDAAKRLDIRQDGALPGEGFGTDIAAFGVAKIKALDVGGLTLADQLFYTMAIAPGGGPDAMLAESAIGYEVAKRAVTVIDYARQEISFIDPSRFRPAADAVPIKFKFDGHIPVIDASVDGIAGEFEIDTGAWSSLIVMRPFAETHDLAGKYHATREVVAGSGAGGDVRGLLFRPKSLKIGSVEIAAPMGDLLLDKRGAGADPLVAGNIGGGILRRFTVTLDYGHQLLYLEPNSDFAAPDMVDRSGLWLARIGRNAFAIEAITPGSPAARAGLAVGDRIIAINDNPVAAMSGPALRDKLRAPADTIVTLTIKHGFQTRNIALKLEDLI